MTAGRLVAAAAIAAAVSAAAVRPWESDAAEAVAWRDVTASAGRLELTRPVTQAFASGADLRRFLRANAPGSVLRLPRIDYRRERAAVVSPGPRSSTGYGVDVVGVTRSADTTTVLLRESAPRLPDEVEPVVTYPYRLLALATTGDVRFRWLGRP